MSTIFQIDKCSNTPFILHFWGYGLFLIWLCCRLFFFFHFTYRIEAVALIDWIFVIRFQFVECDHMEYGEKYQECIRYQCNDVGDRWEIKSHRESRYRFIFVEREKKLYILLTLFAERLSRSQAATVIYVKLWPMGWQRRRRW